MRDRLPAIGGADSPSSGGRRIQVQAFAVDLWGAATQNDGPPLESMVDQIESNVGARPTQLSADAGYCSEENLEALDEREIDAYVATGRQKHGSSSAIDHEEKKKQGPLASAMREKLREGGWESPYRLRKQTVEPGFGQIKEARGFRRFLLRGLSNVKAEWALLCTVHNVLKLAHATAARPICAVAGARFGAGFRAAERFGALLGHP